MYKIIGLSFLIITSLTLNAQEATYEEVKNKKKKGTITKYIDKNGELFEIGDTLILGQPIKENNFYYVVQNAGLGSTFPVGLNAIGKEVYIKSMKAKQNKMFIYTTAPDGYTYGLIAIDSDLAIEQGELKTNALSSDDALEELKKWKDKLDLELITQEEYDKKKNELIKYIK